MTAALSTQIFSLAEYEPLRAARAIIAHEAAALQQVSARLDRAFVEGVHLLRNCRGTVIVTGIGKAGLIGQKVSATLASTGTRSHFLHPTEALHGDLGCMGTDDLLLAFSNSGETEEVCRLLPMMRNWKVPVVAVTGNLQSQLGRAATAAIDLGRLTEAGAHGLAPSTSTTAMLAVGDALALVVCELKGFTPDHFARLHPGGSLGRRLTLVQDVMRQGDQLRVASETETIRQVFVDVSRPGRRTGAVILVDSEGVLSGLFTDSDLARLLEQRREHQLDRPICEVMTKGPLTIRPDAILEEVIQRLSARRVSELPVVDENGRPVGLVDITDVIGLLPAEA